MNQHRSRALVVAFVLGAGSPCVGAIVTHAQRAPSRWVRIRVEGRPAIAYAYRDRMAGPSARGVHVSDPPTAAEITAAVERPTLLVRNPADYGARPLTTREIRRLRLPATPPWMRIYEGRSVAPASPSEASGVVEGRVMHAGAPCVAYVQLVPSIGSVVRSAASDSSGAFRFEDVAPGAYLVVAQHIDVQGVDGALARHAIQVGAASTPSLVEITIPVGRQLDVTAAGTRLAAEPAVYITLHPGRTPPTTADELAASLDPSTGLARAARMRRETAAGISSRFADVLPGDYHACASTMSTPPWCQRVRVAPGASPQSVTIPARRP